MAYHNDNETVTKRRLLPALVLAGLSAFALSACNTVEGAGQDIENTGEAIQDGADEDS
jgi:predicted small secreted protein